MASQEIHVSDIGTEFRCTILDDGTAVDLSGASSIVIKFKKPDNTTLEVDAELYTDGTDGIIFYNAVSGDLDQAGVWKIQALVGIGGGQFYSDIGVFKVLSNI